MRGEEEWLESIGKIWETRMQDCSRWDGGEGEAAEIARIEKTEKELECLKLDATSAGKP